jgi:hypothetical protein
MKEGFKKGEKMKYSVDKEIYSYESLKIANEVIYKIYNNKRAKINPKNDKIEIETEDDIIFKRLLNEALNQQCRMDLFKKTKNLSKMIIAKAIVSALGEIKRRRK